MYSEKNIIYILTLLECIEKCWIYTKDYSNVEEFMWANEQKDLNATISLFIAIGEESKKIQNELKDVISIKINWKSVAGIRDKISHDYRGINEDLLWNTIHNELYLLKDALIEMLKLLNIPKDLLKEFLQSKYYIHIQYLGKIL